MIVKLGLYDGSTLQDRFAYDYYKDKVLRTGNIICWRAGAEVNEKFMVDKQDLIDKDFIYSEDMMHFCMEIPDISLFAGVCFQRLFNNIIGNTLEDFIHEPVVVDGDDIFVIVNGERKKASVSIAKCINGAVLIHTGINIKAGDRAPSFAYSTNLSDDKAYRFMEVCNNMFYETTQDIFVASAKIIV